MAASPVDRTARTSTIGTMDIEKEFGVAPSSVSETSTRHGSTNGDHYTSHKADPAADPSTHFVAEKSDLSEADADNPPNGGLAAWVQVFGAYFLFFNTWGLINAFGAYQTYYDTTLSRSPSDISWIGTFQGFFLMFIGAVAGPLYDKGYLRPLFLSGSFLVVFGLMMTSLSTEYYQVFLSQAVTVGLGCGLLLVPAMAVVAQYFSTKRALALGIVASGGSMGALLYPIVFKQLQVRVSFGWATRAIGFIALATLVISNVCLKSRMPPNKEARALIDLSAFRNPAFLVYTLAVFLYFLGIYMPFFYVSSWAQHYLGTNEELSFYLFSILNAGSLFGRIIPGLVADKYGSINVAAPTILITGILSFAWMGVHSFAELVVFCIFYGFFSGASVSLPGTVITQITPNIDKVGTWMGMAFSLSSLGLLVGNPIVGAILDKSPGGSFVAAQSFSGAVVLAGGVCLCMLRQLQAKRTGTWKV